MRKVNGFTPIGISIVLTLVSLFLLIPNAQVIAQSVSGRLAWSDEFTSQAARWAWSYNAGTGYKTLVQVSGAANAVECGITSASTGSSYSDCSLHEKSQKYTTGILEMRLRTTDDNGITQPGQGTRGWGLWDGGPNAAWFWSASPESDAQLRGLRVQVVRSNSLRLNQALANIDMMQWHIYRVELLANQVKFYVDNNLVASTSERPDNQARAELWIDNYRILLTSGGYTYSYLNVHQNQKMYIDWVRYYELTSNMVVNQSFEVDKDQNSIPDGWARTNSGSNDKRIAASGADGAYIYQISPSGSTTTYKSINQFLNQSGKLNNVWKVTVWSRTQQSSPAGSLRVRIEFKNSSGAVISVSKPLAKNTVGSYQTVSITAPQDYASMKAFLESSVTQGNVYFDNVGLARQ